MALIETWLRCELGSAVQVQYLNGNLFSQDNQANLIGVRVYENGEPASLSGSVSANVIRADGGTVAVAGTLQNGNECYVILPQSAYAVPGAVSVIIKITSSGQVTTLAAAVSTVYTSSTATAVDPGTIIPSIQSLISAIETAVASIPADYSSLWTSLAPAFSTSTAYTAGQYTTYDGKLWRFTTDHAAGSWNAAHAVQVNLGGDVSDLKSALNEFSETTGNTIIELIDNKCVNLAGITADLTPVTPSDVPTRCAVVPCQAGDMFTVTATGSRDSRAYGFVKSNGDIIKKASSYAQVTEQLLVAPTGSDYIIINDTSFSGISYCGRQITDVLTNDINALKNLSDSLYSPEKEPQITWVNKRIDNTTGEDMDGTATKRCCSEDQFPVSGYYKVSWESTTPFSAIEALLYFYNGDHDYIGYQYIQRPPYYIASTDVAYMRIEFVNSSDFDASLFDGAVKLQSKLDLLSEDVDAVDAFAKQIGNGAMHKSVNLFDKTTAVQGYYVKWGTGQLATLANWYASDYIPILPNTKYTLRFTNQCAFYNEYKLYLSGVNGYSDSTAESPMTVTSPTNAAFIRVTVAPAQYESYQIQKGESFTEYEPYGIYLIEEDAIEGLIPSAIQSKNILPELYHATSQNKIRIKLLGDSITAGVGGTGYNTNGDTIPGTDYKMNPDGYCWANLFKEYLEDNFECEVVNYAISGKNTGYYAGKAQTMIESSDDIVICMLGTNDRGESTSTINTVYGGYESLLNRAKTVGAKFIPMANIPADLPNETTHTEHMEKVAFIINAFASDHKLEYVDVFRKMEEYCEYTGTALSTYLDNGSLHPNDSGYFVMYKIITRELGIDIKIDNADW